jgi:hypothetical protein
MDTLDVGKGNRPHSAREVTQDQFDDRTSFVGEDLFALAVRPTTPRVFVDENELTIKLARSVTLAPVLC